MQYLTLLLIKHFIRDILFNSTNRLIHDRELQLYDGSRLLRSDRYDAIKQENSLADEDMTAKGLYRIHPAFRIVALAEPPVLGAAQGQWLTPEALTIFLFHHMRHLSPQETINLVNKLVCSLLE